MPIRLLLSLLVLLALLCPACSDRGESPDPGNDGDVLDGDAPDGDAPDGDAPDGDRPDGDDPDGDAPDGDQPDGDDTDGDAPDGDNTGELPPLVDRSGYIEIEPIDYYMRDDGSVKELTSSACKLWYIFQVANENPEDKPLAVFFNGGPGSATGLLFGFNTARTTMDPAFTTPDAPVADSPAQWTELYNVLYVDARQTGFSYCTVENVQAKSVRSGEFMGRNFNSYFDGADFVRVVLRFLKENPRLRHNPVVPVGESYGGIRASVMLHLALFYTRYADDTMVYQDPSLVAELSEHYAQVFPEYAGQTVPPEVIATQFSHQILVQPLLTGLYQDRTAGAAWEQPDSVMFQIAQEEGITFVPCSEQGRECNPYNNALTFLMYEARRDIYNYTQAAGWLFELGDAVTRKLVIPDILEEASGFDPTTIDALYAVNRPDAYRLIGADESWASLSATRPLVSPEPSFANWLHFQSRSHRPAALDLTTGQMPEVFGELMPWDRYYLDSHRTILGVFHFNDLLLYEVEPYNPRYGELFLENLLYVETFITNAAYDLIIYAPVLAEALARHDSQVGGTDWEQEPQEGEERGGWITVHYKPGAFGLADAASRRFRFPLYEKSCHAVEVTEPVEFLDDVRDWWQESLSR